MWGIPDWVNKPNRETDDKQSYFEVELTPRLRKALLNLIRGGEINEATLKLIETQVMCAREVDMALPAGMFDWNEIEAEAARQGVLITDIIFDRISHKSE